MGTLKTFELNEQQHKILEQLPHKFTQNYKADCYAVPLRKECYGSDALRIEALTRHHKPIFVLPQSPPRLPQFENWTWDHHSWNYYQEEWKNRETGKIELKDRGQELLILRYTKPELWVGDELMPNNGKWYPYTYISAGEIKALPQWLKEKIKLPKEPQTEKDCKVKEPIFKIKKFMPFFIDGEWICRMDKIFIDGILHDNSEEIDEYGRVSLDTNYEWTTIQSPYFLDVLPELDDRLSIFVSVNGWPLKYVPRAYLEWLAYDRTYRQTGRTKIRYTYNPKTRLINTHKDSTEMMCSLEEKYENKNIKKYLELTKTHHEVLFKEKGRVEAPDPLDKEMEWKGFFGTGYWDKKNCVTLLSYTSIDGKTEDFQEIFICSGASKKFKPHLRSYKEMPEREDSDPAPSDWQLKTAIGIPVQVADRQGSKPQPARKETEAWMRALKMEEWLNSRLSHWKRNTEKRLIGGNDGPEILPLNQWDFFEQEQQRSEDQDHWEAIQAEFEIHLEPWLGQKAAWIKELFAQLKELLWPYESYLVPTLKWETTTSTGDW